MTLIEQIMYPLFIPALTFAIVGAGIVIIGDWRKKRNR